MVKKEKKRKISEAKRKEIRQAYEQIGTYYGAAKKLGVDPKTVKRIVEEEEAKREKSKEAKRGKIDWPKLARLLEAGDVTTIMAEFNLEPEELKSIIDRYMLVKEAAVKASRYSETAAMFTERVLPMIHWFFTIGGKKRDACKHFEGSLCTNWRFEPDELPELERWHKFRKDEAGLIRMDAKGLHNACAFCHYFVPTQELVKP